MWTAASFFFIAHFSLRVARASLEIKPSWRRSRLSHHTSRSFYITSIISLGWTRVVNGPTRSGPNPARTRKLISSPNHARIKTNVNFGLKNLAILPSSFDHIFVHPRKKVRLRPELSPKVLSRLDPNPKPTRKARPDLQRWDEVPSDSIQDTQCINLSSSR